MKIIHTSDWHIGKIVNEFSMIDDQKYILQQLLELIDKEKPTIYNTLIKIYYQQKDYDNVLRMIVEKKKKIERVLDLY